MKRSARKAQSGTRSAALPRSALRVGDTAREVLAGLLQRPGRTLLTLLGPILGLGAFVAVMGLTATASGQITGAFTTQAATQVSVTDAGTENLDGRMLTFPDDADDLVMRLNGVRSAGVTWTLPVSEPQVSTSLDPRAPAITTTVKAATPHYAEAAGARLASGEQLSLFEDRNNLRVAVLGGGVAQRLGIADISAQPAVSIDGVPFTVVGVLRSADRDASLVNSVLIPSHTALQIWGLPMSLAPATMLIQTDLGAADLVASQAATALRPDTPSAFRIIPPPSPSSVASVVDQSLSLLFLALAAVVVIIGAIGIANTTYVSVIERTPEIGLRRALGARPRDIAWQFLAESSVLGLIGGLVGSAFGTFAVVITALTNSWTAVMDPAVTIAGPFMGGLIGLVAGVYPALSASKVQPVVALRR